MTDIPGLVERCGLTDTDLNESVARKVPGWNAYRELLQSRAALTALDEERNNYKIWWERDSAALGKVLGELSNQRALTQDFRARAAALDERVKDLEGQRNKLSEFFDKYALGPMLPPSCLVCGQSVTGTPAIQHAELPGVVVCGSCRDAAIARKVTTSTQKMDYGLLDWMDEDAP